jgi:hypothetical protein
MLCRVRWQLISDVLGQMIDPFFKGQTVQEEFFLGITKEQRSHLHSTTSLISQTVVVPNLNFGLPNTKQDCSLSHNVWSEGLV